MANLNRLYQKDKISLIAIGEAYENNDFTKTIRN